MQDHDVRQIFRAPWLIHPKDDVYLLAFFLEVSPDDPKRGGYTLTVEEAGGGATPKIEEEALRGFERARRRYLEALEQYEPPGQVPSRPGREFMRKK